MKIPFTFRYENNKNQHFTIVCEAHFNPEPFHSRETLLNTLRHKVLHTLNRDAEVEISPADLDKALAECNSIVGADEDNDAEETGMTYGEYLDEENERLNLTKPLPYYDADGTIDPDDEDDNWLRKHNELQGITTDDSPDIVSLIKTASFNGKEY